MAQQMLLAAVACSCALAGGTIVAARAIERRDAAAKRERTAGRSKGFHGRVGAGGGLAERIVEFACEAERRHAAPAENGSAGAPASSGRATADERLQALAARAGVAGRLGRAGYRASCRNLSAVCGVAGAVAGAMLSAELAVLFAIAGFLVGWRSVGWAVRSVASRRLSDLERDLPEMLEVVALGLRSGLSFDRSFGLYPAHFDTAFARECASAQRQWSFGLATREDALKGLAERYDSALLRRTVEAAVRSLRFGTSLADVFESHAGEARAVRRARREEQVAKAPVKMMVPTGALILPAMLLLVLGPVLLELMEGI